MSRTKLHQRFSDLLSIGLHSVAARKQVKRLEVVEQEVAEKLGYTSFESVRHWRKGCAIPKDLHQVEFLVRYCATYGYISRDWARDFLTHAKFEQGRTAILDELFPNLVSSKASHKRLAVRLPRMALGFRGRDAEQANIIAHIVSEDAPVVVIYGAGGIGKTALAVACSHALVYADEQSPAFETVVLTSAHDAKVSLNQVLDEIGRVLGYPETVAREYAIEKKIAPIQGLLRKSRVLLVIDDFDANYDPKLTEFLLEGVPQPSKVIITTRDFHPVLWQRTYGLLLQGLHDEDALDVLRTRAQDRHLKTITDAHDDELLPLVRLTAGNPYALLTALGLVAFQWQSLSDVVRDLAHGQGQLFDHIFRRVWSLLEETERRILQVTSFFAEPVPLSTISLITGIGEMATSRCLGHLAELSLVTATEQVGAACLRFSCHSLTKAFAAARMADAPEQEATIRANWVRFYVDWSAQVLVGAHPEDCYWNTQMTMERLAQLDVEWLNIRQVFVYTAHHKHDAELVELLKLYVRYFNRRALFEDRMAFSYKAAAAALRLGDAESAALFHIDAIGWTLIEQGHYARAQVEILQGLQLAKSLLRAESCEANDLLTLGEAFLARLHLEQNQIALARKHMRLAKRKSCSPAFDARVQLVAGELAYRQQHYPKAVQLYQAALKYSLQYSQTGDYEWQYRLGFALLATGQADDAEKVFVLMLSFASNSFSLESTYARFGLAKVAQTRDDLAQARAFAQQAEHELNALSSSHPLMGELQAFVKQL